MSVANLFLSYYYTKTTEIAQALVWHTTYNGFDIFEVSPFNDSLNSYSNIEVTDEVYLERYKSLGIQQLANLDKEELKEIDIVYILSAIPIKDEKRFQFEKKFSREDAYWDIYLYKLESE